MENSVTSRKTKNCRSPPKANADEDVVLCAMTGTPAWIVDMCNDRSVFVEYKNLETPLKVKLGEAVGRGVVVQITQWQKPDLQVEKCSVCPKIII